MKEYKSTVTVTCKNINELINSECWVIFPCFCCRLLTFFIISFQKNSFRNTIRVSNCLDPDQDRHSVSPDLGPNCLQRSLL